MNFFTKVPCRGPQVLEFEDLERMRKFKDFLYWELVYNPPESLSARKRIREHAHEVECWLTQQFTDFVLDNNRSFEPKIKKDGTNINNTGLSEGMVG